MILSSHLGAMKEGAIDESKGLHLHRKGHDMTRGDETNETIFSALTRGAEARLLGP
jgi:hypothetical protein